MLAQENRTPISMTSSAALYQPVTVSTNGTSQHHFISKSLLASIHGVTEQKQPLGVNRTIQQQQQLIKSVVSHVPQLQSQA